MRTSKMLTVVFCSVGLMVIGCSKVREAVDIYTRTPSSTETENPSLASGPGIITTVVGGIAGESPDGTPATQARLKQPWGMFVDASGNIFVADTINSRILRMDSQTGLTSIVAGKGDFGFSGDGGPATEANLLAPKGVFVDSAGNLFIADDENHRIRRVDAQTGIITTVAGSGEVGRGKEAGGYAGDGGLATEAKLKYLRDVWVDGSGNLFISGFNSYIRRVDSQTGIITTVAGGGNPQDGLGDGGLATEAKIGASGIFIDATGNLFILGSGRVRRVDSQTGIINTVAKQGGRAMFIDSAGNIFTASSTQVHRVDGQTGNITTVVGTGTEGYSGDGGLATEAELHDIRDIFVDSAGNLFIVDMRCHCVRRVESIAAPTTLSIGVYAPQTSQ